MEHIDTWILNKFQKIADFFQEWIGWTNFKLARIILFLYLLLSLFSAFSFFTLSVGSGVLLAVNLFAVFFVSIHFYFSWLMRAENSTQNNKIFKNPLVVENVFSRFLWTFFFLPFIFTNLISLLFTDSLNDKGDSLFVFHIFDTLKFIFTISFVYFVSCTPKPHKPSKLKKAISSMKETLSSGGVKTSPVPS